MLKSLVTASALLALAQAAQPPSAPAGSPERLIGSVQAVDAARGELLVTSGKPGEAPRRVRVPPGAPVFRYAKARPADFRQGDEVTLTGTAIQVLARSIEIAPPEYVEPAPSRARPSQQAPARPGGRVTAPAGPPPNVRVRGRVVQLNPFTVALPDGLRVQVTARADTRFTRLRMVRLATVRKGEPLVATGTADGDVFIASRVQVGFEGFPLAPGRARPARAKPRRK